MNSPVMIELFSQPSDTATIFPLPTSDPPSLSTNPSRVKAEGKQHMVPPEKKHSSEIQGIIIC